MAPLDPRSDGQPPRPRRRARRLIFAAGLAVVLYIFTELLSFVGGALLDHHVSWMAGLQYQRAELRTELEARPGVVLQVHPYVGYVEQPPRAIGADASGRRTSYAVSPYGYADANSPIQRRAGDRVIIAVTGGSVAWAFHRHGTARLSERLQTDPAFAGKDLVFVNLAVAGYKQPQQLMTLNYLLVLGAQFDIVINIDGFNEAALYEAENAAQHVFPAFPRSWHTRVEVAGPKVARYLGPIENQVAHRLDLARRFSRAPWCYSPVCNLAWWIADARAEIALRTLQEEYRDAPPPASNYTVDGPGWRFASREALHRHLAALWQNSSIQLDNLCRANGIRYYHFLQPNLFVSESKPLTAAEAHMARHRDDMYRPGVLGVHPLLAAAGRVLQARGERFTDLTAMFTGHPEPVFVDICHLNQAGNDILADRIADAILSSEAAPPRTTGPANPARPARPGHRPNGRIPGPATQPPAL
jgi:hypothetical protein